MNRSDTKHTGFPRELNKLKQKLFEASREMRRASDHATRKKLEHRVNDLKSSLGWELLDRGYFEYGLALYSSLPDRTCGEDKSNGMSRALTGMGLHHEARQVLEKGLSRYPESCALWVGMGALHAKLDNNFEALECLETALRFSSEDNSTILFNKAQILNKIGCYTDVLTILQDLIDKKPWDTGYLILLGACHLDMGLPEEALRDYRKALELWRLDPTPYEGGCLYMGVYSSYRTLGMFDEALAIGIEGIKQLPEEDPGLYQNVADAYYVKGWRKEAIGVLKVGIEKFPEDEELKNFLKDIEDSLDDPDDGKKPPLLGLLVLLALIRKRFGKGDRR